MSESAHANLNFAGILQQTYVIHKLFLRTMILKSQVMTSHPFALGEQGIQNNFADVSQPNHMLFVINLLTISSHE